MIVKSNRILLSLLLLFFLRTTADAQPFAAYQNSHYAGVYGLMSNPASGAGSRYKWDVNIIGASVTAGNTYVRFPKSAIFNPPDKFRRGENWFPDTLSKRTNQNGWGYAEIMMPSVLYAIDEKQSVAFLWRVRSAGNGGKPSTGIANFFALDFPNPRFNNRNMTLEYGAATGHIWNEFGFSYSRIIKDNGNGRWKAGITLKYLGGIAAGYAVADDVNFIQNSRRSGSITSGTLRYGYSENLDTWEKPHTSNFKPFQNPGIGVDIGVIYEWRSDGDGFGSYDNPWQTDADDYKLRIGVSITDIGGISYRKAANNTDLDLRKADFNPNTITYKDGESLRQYAARLNRTFTPIESDDRFFMALPTALNLMGDYNIDGRFFVSANAVLALTAGQRKLSKNYALTQLQVVPRYETRMFGAYLPLTVNHNGQADAGAAIRIGPLLIGSSTIFTNLFQQRINHADAFVALRINPSFLTRGDGNGIFRQSKNQVGCPTY